MIKEKESGQKTLQSRIHRQCGNKQDQHHSTRNYWNSPFYEMREIRFGDGNAIAGTGFFRMKVLPLLRLIYTLLSTSGFLKGLRIGRWKIRMETGHAPACRQCRDRQILLNSTRDKRQKYIALSLRKETRIVRKNMPVLYAPRLQQED